MTVGALHGDYAHAAADGVTRCGLAVGGVLSERYGHRPLCPRCRVAVLEEAS